MVSAMQKYPIPHRSTEVFAGAQHPSAPLWCYPQNETDAQYGCKSPQSSREIRGSSERAIFLAPIWLEMQNEQ